MLHMCTCSLALMHTHTQICARMHTCCRTQKLINQRVGLKQPWGKGEDKGRCDLVIGTMGWGGRMLAKKTQNPRFHPTKTKVEERRQLDYCLSSNTDIHTCY